MKQIPDKAFKFGPLALTTTLTTDILRTPIATGGIGVDAGLLFSIKLHHISVINKTATPRTFSLWVGQSGTNTAGEEVIAQGVTVDANKSFDYYGEITIRPGEYLVGGASANTALTITGEGIIEAMPGMEAVTSTRDSGTGATETVPDGASLCFIEMWAGGGGGGGDNGTELANGGGSSGYGAKTVAVRSGQTFTYTVGAFGSAGGLNDAGGDGGASSISGLTSMTVNGGFGGDITEGTGGAGGAAGTGGDVNTAGNATSSSAGANAPNSVGRGDGGNGGLSAGNAGTAGRIVFRYI